MKNRKGIVLAGGSGTRLYPLTKGITKQLLPVYDKPMVYYPISTLMLAGIQDILIISTPRDMAIYQSILGSGENWGVHFEYAIQERPDGLASAFIIGEQFIGENNVALVLGDNIFYGDNFSETLRHVANQEVGATIFGYHVNDPSQYGVVEFDSDNQAVAIEEKPTQPKSHYAVPGLYFYDNQVVDIAKHLVPSARSELEITDINNIYLQQQKLSVKVLKRGHAWFDTGTLDDLLAASNFVQALEKRQGLKICCPEEIAFKNGWITEQQLMRQADALMKSGYGRHLKYVLDEL